MKRQRLLSAGLVLMMLLSFTVTAFAEEESIVLPEDLLTVGTEAFMNDTSIRTVQLPEGIQTIGARAFKDSTLSLINLPASITMIDDSAFEGVESFSIIADRGSYAYQWAIDKGYGSRIVRGSTTVLDLAESSDAFHFSGETYPESNPDLRMAHNIYSDPDLSGTSGSFSAFSIDFMTENSAENTYWALCNWGMDVSNLADSYTVTDAGGAYAGLQNRGFDTAGIMAFWETQYKDSNGKQYIMNAHRIYPSGEDFEFGGEGEGTNYIDFYDWEPEHWYRMLLRCFEGPFGSTVVEQWIMDLETGEWTLFSCFDTGLRDSCFIGDMSQFMENYYGESSNELRSFRYKNIFVKEYGASEWTPITASSLSTDIWWDNKKGNYAFGSDGEAIWGITNGTGEDVIKGDEHGPVSQTFSFVSDEAPAEPPQITDYYDGRHIIVTALNRNYALTASSNGNAALYQYEEDETDEQLFELENLGGGLWKIVSADSGLALTAAGSGESTANVFLSEFRDLQTQHWRIQSAGDSTVFIINAAYGKYLDVVNASAGNGKNVQVFNRNSAYRAQNWYIR